jgi:glucokinase
MSGNSRNIAGVDIGGTKIMIVLAGSDGGVKKVIEMKTAQKPPEQILSEVSAAISALGRSGCIGVGIAGDVDSKNGILRFSPNLPKWKNVRIKEILQKKSGVPVTVDNDANCAAYGSYVIDGKRKYPNFVTVTLGTGVGGGLIFRGQLYRGGTGTAGEIGHITVNPSGPRCGCGNMGCLEAYIGTAGIINIAKKHGFKTGTVTPATVAAAAYAGDQAAAKVYDEVAHYLAVGLGSIINMLNPDMISIAGGVAHNLELIEPGLRNELPSRTFSTPLRHVKIVKTKDIKHLGAVGAAFLAHDAGGKDSK